MTKKPLNAESSSTNSVALKSPNKKFTLAPSIEHYCVVNSLPMTAEEIIREYKKSETQEGLIIMHYLKDNSRSISFRFSKNLYIFRSPNSLDFITPTSYNSPISYSGQKIYRMKFLPLTSTSQTNTTSGWPKERENEITHSFKGLIYSWTYSKNISDQHIKISRILQKNIHPTTPIGSLKKLRKLLCSLFRI